MVWCIGNTPEYKPGAFNQYVHMIEMAANGSLFEQFARVEALNARIAAGERPDGRTTPVVLHVIKPERPLPLDPAARTALIAMADGDGRFVLNLAEQVFALGPAQPLVKDAVVYARSGDDYELYATDAAGKRLDGAPDKPKRD